MSPRDALAAILLALLGIAGGHALAAEDNEMIVAGTEAPEGKYPWQVRLYSSVNDQRGFCGGTIIAPQWILTAGHCVTVGDKEIGPHTIQDTAKVVVGYGSNDRTKTKKIEVEKIFIRDEFKRDGLAGKGDVALLKLKTPIPNPKMITIADPAADAKFVKEGVKLTATGRGALWSPFDRDVGALMPELGSASEMMDKWQFPLKLREVQIDAMDNTTCKAVFEGSPFSVAPTEICAMVKGTTKDICQGDSGGPLLVQASDSPQGYYQVGVVSWTTICGSTTKPSVFARVSPFTGWINDTMKSN
ncbi:MAG TPA: serine protease [Methyloceanibacter sp.]|nr:serine protease [Methyloceanibacter sp.]